MILCDTNIIIELYRRNQAIITALKTIGPDNLAISAAVAAELIYGALNKVELRQISRDIDSLLVLPIAPAISDLMLTLMAQYCLSNRLSLPDALIAATALHHGLPLYTLNRKDFRYIPDLQLYEPA